MKALVIKEPHQPLELQERADLEGGSGEAVIKLKSAALKRRDFWITQGMYPGIESEVILGSDGAGVVSQVGEGVDEAWLGKEVILNPSLDWGDHQAAFGDEFSILGLPVDGTFATEIKIRVSQLHAKPDHLDWLEAAALPLAGLTAYRALFSQGKMARVLHDYCTLFLTEKYLREWPNFPVECFLSQSYLIISHCLINNHHHRLTHLPSVESPTLLY